MGPSSRPDNMQPAIRSYRSTIYFLFTFKESDRKWIAEMWVQWVHYRASSFQVPCQQLSMQGSWTVPGWLQAQRMLLLQAWFCSTSIPGSTETKQSKIHLVECRNPNIQAQAQMSQRPAFPYQDSGQKCQRKSEPKQSTWAWQGLRVSPHWGSSEPSMLISKD